MIKRIAPALSLLLLSPLIAEFLLGDFSIRQLGYLAIFVPLYGASALFIREVVRRTNRGWPTILTTAAVFGLLMEGIVNQTLFNPNYAGQHLLAYGFITELGTSLNYAIFIVTLHATWSICTPIAFIEGLSGERADKPWLRNSELALVGLLGIMGMAGTAASTIQRFHFSASVPQYLSVLFIILILMWIGFKLMPSRDTETAKPEHPASLSVWLVLLMSLVLSSVFMFWFHYAPHNHINSFAGIAAFLLIILSAIAVILFWSATRAWTNKHILAAATGAIMTYGWFGLNRLIGSGHTALGAAVDTIDIAGQAGLLLILLGLSYSGLRQTGKVL